jgi:hypothetical protein
VVSGTGAKWEASRGEGADTGWYAMDLAIDAAEQNGFSTVGFVKASCPAVSPNASGTVGLSASFSGPSIR